MNYRYLRIAFSATCGIAAVLLIALWVRSNDTFDRIGIILSKTKTLVLVSHTGHLSAVVVAYHPSMGNGGWDHGPLAPASPMFANTSWPGPTVAGFGWISNSQYDYVPNYPMQAEWQQLNLRLRSWTENATGLIIPFWILLLSLICLGLVCSFGFPLPHRFSLRTLLIATTLVAVGLGMIVYFAH